MIETIPLLELLDQFVNTWAEWHYLAVGLMAGGLIGYIVRDVAEWVKDRYYKTSD